MIPPTPFGIRSRVANDTTTITRNATGPAPAAGCATSGSSQPDGGPANTVHSTAPAAAPPPVTIPAAAPADVNPRHQMPSTSSGQKLDAATANARPTTVDTSNADT